MPTPPKPNAVGGDRPSYRITLRGRHKVSAVWIEFDAGWVHADVVRFRIEVDEDENTSRRVRDRVERCSFPASRVESVVHLGDDTA